VGTHKSKPKAVKTVKKAPKKRTQAIVRKRPAAAPTRAVKQLDVSAFPSESIVRVEKWICLACVLDVFTRHLKLAPKTAHLEIKRHTPSLDELKAPDAMRPYFVAQSPKDVCPYCGSASKWHARLTIYRIESGKATDALRRELVKSLPKTGDQVVVLEEKATQRRAFFEWLDKISAHLNLDDPGWLMEVSRHYLSRKEPKTDWPSQFKQAHSIRRSRRLESGWELDSDRLFLAPVLFDELLLVQYLVSRSHKAGGLTFEGRYTLPELFFRLRNAGYLRALGVQAGNPGDTLEELVEYLGGGEASLRFYYVVDRREFLERVKTLQDVKAPRPKKRD
jgi:hypothetical protein